MTQQVETLTSRLEKVEREGKRQAALKYRLTNKAVPRSGEVERF